MNITTKSAITALLICAATSSLLYAESPIERELQQLKEQHEAALFALLKRATEAADEQASTKIKKELATSITGTTPKQTISDTNEAPLDPVIGRWRWTDKQVVDCKSDNTFFVTPTNRKGTWKLMPEKTVERKYVFFWDGGLFVDHLAMARGEKELEGKNQDGKEIRATKLQ